MIQHNGLRETSASPESLLTKGSPVVLVLEDGTFFLGRSCGYEGPFEDGFPGGEVVFCTSMTGYQEILTDPSYRGQMVVLTFPLIGNYGIYPEHSESSGVMISGLIVREACEEPSHWQSKDTLSECLAEHHVVGIEGVDTRALTRHLRRQGTQRGVIAGYDESLSPDALRAHIMREILPRARQVQSISEVDYVAEVSRKTVVVRPEVPGSKGRVVLVDTGAKENIIRCLEAEGLSVTIVPSDVTKEMLAALGEYDGLVLANGPGDPENLDSLVALVRDQLLPSRIPIMGICLGHQVIGRAIGGTTSRLTFGHHGANHPVRHETTGRVTLSSQNHNFQVDADSIPADSGFRISHINLSDGSVEGLESENMGDLPVFSVQYHPEAAPGPEDNRYLFDRFANLVVRSREIRTVQQRRQSLHARRHKTAILD